MTLIKMHLSEKYDRKKTVLIVGKGPSARFIPKSDEYYVACLNQAGRLVEHCDFQFVGDQKPYHDMLEDYVERVDNLIFPTKFNLQNTTGDNTIEYVDRTLPPNVQKYAYTFCGPTVWHCHDFDFAMKVSVMCTGELSFYWLLKQGFKNFKSVGIDKNFGNNRRHKIFISNGDCPDVTNGNLFDGWEEFMYNRKQKLIRENNANWEII